MEAFQVDDVIKVDLLAGYLVQYCDIVPDLKIVPPNWSLKLCEAFNVPEVTISGNSRRTDAQETISKESRAAKV
jgi:hypothetical protein